jgi:hypothetical protein
MSLGSRTDPLIQQRRLGERLAKYLRKDPSKLDPVSLQEAPLE